MTDQDAGTGETARVTAPHDDAAPGIEETLARLVGLDDVPTAEHVGVLESVHDALVAELARTED